MQSKIKNVKSKIKKSKMKSSQTNNFLCIWQKHGVDHAGPKCALVESMGCQDVKVWAVADMCTGVKRCNTVHLLLFSRPVVPHVVALVRFKTDNF